MVNCEIRNSNPWLYYNGFMFVLQTTSIADSQIWFIGRQLIGPQGEYGLIPSDPSKLMELLITIVNDYATQIMQLASA